MRPLARLIFVTLLAVALSGCKHAPSRGAGPTVVVCGERGCPADPSTATATAAPPRDGGTLVVHVEAEPAILCDLVEHDAWSRWIVENQVAETLLYQDPWSGAIGPRLAKSWELPAGRLILHLRPGVKWHDGQPFTSADVAFTLGRAQDPKVGADQRADLEPIAKIETPDPLTVVLTLGRPAPYLKQALAHISMLPEHAYRGLALRTAPASRAPIGTGPFRFVEWKPGERIVIARNDAYWGPRPHLDKIVFQIVRDKEVAYRLYRRGQLDVMRRLPPGRTVDEARRDPSLTGHRLFLWTPRAYFFIVWNTRKPPLDDARVRRALTELTDKRRFIQIGFDGHARPITGPYVPGTASYDSSIAPWPYDPNDAKRLLAEAGVKKLELTFLLTAGSRTVEQLATLLKEDFARAGVTLDVATVDWAVLLDRLRHHAFDASALQWTLSLEQDNYDMFDSTEADRGQNYGGFHSGAADALMDQIRVTVDDTARHGLERQLHRVLHDEQPYTFLSSPEVATLEAPRVHDLAPSMDGFSFAQAWVDPPKK
ncbi:MAG TPA: ABC transporter substrate-binding protein [Polyangia bacterium]